MVRLGLFCAFFLAATSFAQACAGQAGKELFSDDFSDDSGGWETYSSMHFVDHALNIVLDPKLDSLATFNSSFNATEGDYCADFVFPSTPPETGNPDDVGMFVLGSNVNNKFSFTVSTLGEAWIFKTSNGQPRYLMFRTKLDSIKTEPGAVNTLRTVVKDQKLTFFVNGQQVKVVRSPISPAANRFGFWAGTDGAAPKQPRTYQIKSYAVTDGH